jgi:hypothetical protein
MKKLSTIQTSSVAGGFALGNTAPMTAVMGIMGSIGMAALTSVSAPTILGAGILAGAVAHNPKSRHQVNMLVGTITGAFTNYIGSLSLPSLPSWGAGTSPTPSNKDYCLTHDCKIN